MSLHATTVSIDIETIISIIGIIITVISIILINFMPTNLKPWMKWKISQGEEKKKNPNSRKNRKTKIFITIKEKKSLD